jgi:hypothetical protein
MKSINWQTLSHKTLSEVKRSLSELPSHQKTELVSWLSAAQKIKTDSELSRAEKTRKLEALDTSEFIFNFIKATTTAFVNAIPIDNKKPLQFATTGALGALALFNFEWAGLAFFAFKKGLPTLILNEQADPVLAFLQEALTEEGSELSETDPNLAEAAPAHDA